MVENLDALKAIGITPVGVSVDAPANTLVTKAALKVTFPLLSDPTLSAHRAFKVVNHLSDERVAELAGYDLDIEAWAETSHHIVAVPALFLIDEQMTVRFAHADRDYKRRPDMPQLLSALSKIVGR